MPRIPPGRTHLAAGRRGARRSSGDAGTTRRKLVGIYGRNRVREAEAVVLTELLRAGADSTKITAEIILARLPEVLSRKK